MMLLLLVTISSINTNVFDSYRKEKGCENPCLVCQKAVYKLKFQKQADCGNSRCRQTCDKVWELWNRPQSPFAGFRGDNLGKCDSCFRAGFCSISECSAQKSMEKTVIDQVVNKAKLTGFVDNSIMKKMLKKVMKNKTVNFNKYAKKIKKQVKKNSQLKTFKKNFKKVSETLKILASASSTKDVKLALKNVQKEISKAKASETVKASIRKLAENFKGLVEAKRTSKSKKKNAKKIVKTAKKVKSYINGELKNLLAYSKRLQKTKKQVEKAISALKNQTVIKKKTAKKLAKLENVLSDLKQVLQVLNSTEKDINNTLAVIKKAAAEFKN